MIVTVKTLQKRAAVFVSVFLALLSGCFPTSNSVEEKAKVEETSKNFTEDTSDTDEEYTGSKEVVAAGSLMVGQIESDLAAANLNLDEAAIKAITNGTSEDLAAAGTIAVQVGLTKLTSDSGFQLLNWGTTAIKKVRAKAQEMNPLYFAANSVTGTIIENISNSEMPAARKQAILKVVAYATVKGKKKAYDDPELSKKLKPEYTYGSFHKVASNICSAIAKVGVSKEEIRKFAKDYAGVLIKETKNSKFASDTKKNVNSILSGLAAGSTKIKFDGQSLADENHPTSVLNEIVFEKYNEENNTSLNPDSIEDFETISKEVLLGSMYAGEENVGEAAEFVTKTSIVDYDATPEQLADNLNAVAEIYEEDDTLVAPEDITSIMSQEELFTELKEEEIITEEESQAFDEKVDAVAAAAESGDADSDGDGHFNEVDAFPDDPTEHLDTDLDGIGNNADTDDDGDTVSDADEILAGTNPLLADTDADGVIDSLDAFPLDPAEWLDTDGDGVGNNADGDDDGDGINDALEGALGTNPLLADTDGDGVIDGLDAFPLDPSESLDADGDGIGDFTDPDDDNDGVPDLLDLFPYDPTESADIDADGIGDNADTDDDNDGSPDGVDLFPLDPSEWMDSDSDGIGDNADTDDDNDLLSDTEESSLGTNPLSADSDTDGTIDGNDAFPLDNTKFKPELSIVAPAPIDINSLGEVRFDLTYLGEISAVNLTSGDVTLNVTGGVSCTITINDGTTPNPHVLLSNCASDGTVGITVGAGTANRGTSADLGATSSTVNVDNTPPNVTIGAPSSATFSPSTTATYTLTYDFVPTSLDSSDIIIGGDSTDCIVTVSNEATLNPVVSITGCSVDGSKTITLSGGTSQDQATNPDLGAGPSAPTTLDTSVPTVNISAPSTPSINSSGTVSFGITYSGDNGVYDLQATDITLDTTGTVTCNAPVINGAATSTPSVDITNCLGDGTVGITIGADVVRNAATSPNTATSSTIATVDNTAPLVNIGAPTQTHVNYLATTTFELTFEGAPAALVAGDITVNGNNTGCTVAIVDSATTTPDVEVSGCSDNGTISISVAAGESVDAAGNLDAGAGPSASVTVDNTAPTVSIGAPDVSIINSSATVTFGLTYEIAPTALVAGDITILGNNTDCSVNVLNATSTTPSVEVSGCSDDGSITISVAASESVDAAGNLDAGAGPSASVTVDNTAPTVTIGVPSVSSINVGTSVTFELTYEEAPVGMVTTDITVNGDSAGCTVGLTDETTTTPDVTISDCSANGSITITLAGGRSSDAAGNVDVGAGPSASVTVDNVVPTVNISAPSSTDIKSADTLSFNITYTDASVINGITDAEITLNYTGGVTCTEPVTVNNGGTATPSIDITGCSGDGTVSMSVAAGVIENASAIANLLTTSNTVNVDNTAPTVTIAAPDLSIINAADTVTFTLTYEEIPSALVAGDITVAGNNTDCAVAIVDPASTTPDVQISGCSADGSITISVAASESVDAAGNLDAGAGPSASVTVDNTAPTVTIGAPDQTSIDSADTVTFTLTYEEIPASLVAGDITVSGNNTGCSVAIVDPASTTPDVQVSGCSDNGSITISVAAGESVDAAGNLDAGAGPSASVTVDNTAPTVTIGTPDLTDINSSNTVTFTHTYEEIPSALVPGDITVGGNNTDCSVAILDPATITPDVQVSGCSDDGSINIFVAPGKSFDTAGNMDMGAGPSAWVTVTNTLPSVAVTIGPPSVAAMNVNGTATFVLTYDYVPTALVPGDITVNGDNTGCSVSIVDAATHTPEVSVIGCSGDGNISISVAAGKSTDGNSNFDEGAGPSPTVTIDNIAPTVSIDPPDLTKINFSDTVTFILTYEEAPTALVPGDITINGANTGCSVSILDPISITPEVLISECSAMNGSISISLNPGTSQDLAGNQDSGAGPSVSVEVRNGWYQEAYIKANNVDSGDQFGHSVSIYGDTMAVGARYEGENSTVIINGSTAPNFNGAANSGATYIYRRSANDWQQEAYIKASNSETGDRFGTSLSLYADTLAVGASGEDAASTVIVNGTTSSNDNLADGSGAVYIYQRSGSIWAQQAYIKAANADSLDYFGSAISLYGNSLAVGADREKSSQTTVTNGTTASPDNTLSMSGAVYVYHRTGATWNQEAYIKAANAGGGDAFGFSVSMDSNLLAIGAKWEDSSQTIVTNGNTADSDNFSMNSGAVFIYRRTGSNWAQEAYAKAANSNADDEFGSTVSINGNTLVVGAPYEDSAQTTITNGFTVSADNTTTDSGAVYVYRYTGSLWNQESYIKASNAVNNLGFGSSISLSGDTLAVGAHLEGSSQTTITNSSNSSFDSTSAESGAVYVFHRTGNIWEQEAYIKASNSESNDSFGTSVSVSGDSIAVGASNEGESSSIILNDSTDAPNLNGASGSGAVYVYRNRSRLFEPAVRIVSVSQASVSFEWNNTNLGAGVSLVVAPAVSSGSPGVGCSETGSLMLSEGTTTYTYSGLTASTPYAFRFCTKGKNGDVSEGTVKSVKTLNP